VLALPAVDGDSLPYLRLAAVLDPRKSDLRKLVEELGRGE